MDYQVKYLKYKNKYLNLQKQLRGGAISYPRILKINDDIYISFNAINAIYIYLLLNIETNQEKKNIDPSQENIDPNIKLSHEKLKTINTLVNYNFKRKNMGDQTIHTFTLIESSEGLNKNDKRLFISSEGLIKDQQDNNSVWIIILYNESKSQIKIKYINDPYYNNNYNYFYYKLKKESFAKFINELNIITYINNDESNKSLPSTNPILTGFYNILHNITNNKNVEDNKIKNIENNNAIFNSIKKKYELIKEDIDYHLIILNNTKNLFNKLYYG